MKNINISNPSSIRKTVFISASIDDGLTDKRGLQLRKILDFHGFYNVRPVEGCYKGKTEPSLCVEVKDKEGLELLKALGFLFRQESILIVDNRTSEAELFFCEEKKSQIIGKWRRSNSLEVQAVDAYTKINDLYFVVD